MKADFVRSVIATHVFVPPEPMPRSPQFLQYYAVSMHPTRLATPDREEVAMLPGGAWLLREAARELGLPEEAVDDVLKGNQSS